MSMEYKPGLKSQFHNFLLQLGNLDICGQHSTLAFVFENGLAYTAEVDCWQIPTLIDFVTGKEQMCPSSSQADCTLSEFWEINCTKHALFVSSKKSGFIIKIKTKVHVDGCKKKSAKHPHEEKNLVKMPCENRGEV